ncbi:Lipoprotein LpqB, GerMN domain protein [[Leptolyngbya] sp. PCC 7376]|nr:Lipoprotein LpqB, GerMN domain protein [[Leptolyngbya] sp. PCC 7376]
MVLSQRRFGALWAVAIAALILVGCDEETTQNSTNNTETPSETPTLTAESKEPRVYWLEDNGDRLELVPESVMTTKSNAGETLDQLMIELTQTTPEGDRSSALPENTKVISHTIQDDGIVINLSEEFTLGGGSASMIGRLGQVLYTATSIEPDAAVWFQIEGQPLELLGGEGLVVEQPMTRAIFEQEFEL